MKIRYVLLLVVLSVVLVNASKAQSGLDDEWTDLEQYWRSSVSEAGVVGSSLMLLHDGKILKTAYDGLADRESGRAIDEHTIYHWASITKTLTGIAIMQLRDRGLIDLDDSIVKYVPELEVVHNPYGDMHEITLRHLMSHAAGFRGPTWPWSGEEWHPHEPTEWDQIVAMLPYTEILFKPDSKFSYSNPGIIFLGQVIERLTGEDYEVYMEKNILRPLGMRASYFDHTPQHLLKHRSNNYIVTDGTASANGLDFDTGITVSNGGLNAPLGDMSKYIAFLSGAADAPDNARNILSRDSLEEMWEIHQPISSDGDITWSLGLLFFIYDKGDTRNVGHTGGQRGFRSFIYLNPATGAACIAAFNSVVRVRDDSGNLREDDTGFVEVRRRFFERIFPLFDVD